VASLCYVRAEQCTENLPEASGSRQQPLSADGNASLPGGRAQAISPLTAQPPRKAANPPHSATDTAGLSEVEFLRGTARSLDTGEETVCKEHTVINSHRSMCLAVTLNALQQKRR